MLLLKCNKVKSFFLEKGEILKTLVTWKYNLNKIIIKINNYKIFLENNFQIRKIQSFIFLNDL